MKRKPYRHLLIATDGSALAAKGIRVAMALAQALDARVRAVYVAPTDAKLLQESAGVHGAAILIEHFDASARAAAKKALDAARAAAKRAGVRCTAEIVRSGEPWKGVLDVAQRRKCDLLVLASHGRSPLSALVFGSQSAQILSRTDIAVLVVH